MIVAINNAWQIRDDWGVSIYPSDFPEDRHATAGQGQRLVSADEYVPAQNRFGGFVYAGGTMVFTAAYWALDRLKPSVMAFLGTDMVYTKTQSHFYGQGTADPLRKDVTLRNLEAKSARFEILAAEQGCATTNLSDLPHSRLVFSRGGMQDLPKAPRQFSQEGTEAAKTKEANLGYYVESGKYWKEEGRFDTPEIDALDAMWLKALG